MEFVFGEHFLDAARRELRRRGELVAVEPQVFDLLIYLIQNRDRVVSKDELLEAIWGGRIVSESALTTRINAVRKAVGDTGAAQRVIRTIQRKGVRFVGEVREAGKPVAPVEPPPAAEDPLRSALQSTEIDRPADRPEPGKERDARPPEALAERRQLTVMSCNLAGSAPLASRLDPEDLRDLFAGYRRAVAEIATRFEGFVAPHSGDGVSIYFGYPRAHEDDAERAICCALTVADMATPLDPDEKLPTRAGIATSMVVVGGPIDTGGSREGIAVGEAPGLATRLQEIAAPHCVLIAESTRRLVGELFEYQTVAATGTAGPMQVWRVIRPSAVASRFEALRGSSLTGLVGRDEEIDLLLRRWARAKAGDGHVVLVSGEPGLGKSRIVAALQERLGAQTHLRLSYFCSPYHQDSALYPFIAQLGGAAGFAPGDSPASKLEKLETLLSSAPPPDGDVAFLADLLSLPASERYPIPDLSPQRKKARTLEALIRQLEGLARQQPAVIVFEDAHWIDPTSHELLDLAVERVRSMPVLLIVTFRPEFQPPWAGQAQVSMLALNRLDRRDRAALVAQTAGGKVLPGEVVAEIADRTDGVPLFVEELTRSVLESGALREEADRYVLDGALPPFAIPATLHGSLMARLDRLASVRHVAQIGAAIGREFSYALLRAVSRASEDELETALAQLVASELVFQRGRPPDAVYAFKHVLVQNAAHASLPRNIRRQLHAKVAEALETSSPEIMESHPELLAQHYAEAGLVEKSVACWSKAGRRSAARSAMAEAAAQLQKGLNQLALLPDTLERRRRELEFRSDLGAVLQAVKGFAAPETGRAYARAQELWEQLGSPTEFIEIPFGQSSYLAICGELESAQRVNDDLLRMGRQHSDSAGLVLGHTCSGMNAMFTGRFASSRSQLEAGLAHYDPVSHRSLLHHAGTHPRGLSQSFLGIALLCLGFPAQALAQNSGAIDEARRMAQPYLAASLSLGVVPLALVGDDTALSELASELVAVATEQGFAFYRAWGTIFLGWAKVKNGDVTGGMSLLRSGSAAYRSTGAQLWMPYFTALLAGACEIAGQIEESLIQLDDASQIVERTGERWFAAELSRHKGRLLARQGHSEAAEEHYRKALVIAAEQEAKLWELRAAMSLARLWRDRGREAEARDLLAPVYGWFTEGFDTPDLRDAKALLDELNGSAAPIGRLDGRG